MKKYSEYKTFNSKSLNSIPKHWSFNKFKRVSYMKGRIGWQGLKQSEFLEDKTLPFLITGMNFKGGVIKWNEVYHITENRYEEAPEIQLKNGDVLMTKDGTIGKLLYIDELPGKASLNSHLLVFRPLKNEYNTRFLYYQLQTEYFFEHVELTKTGTTFFGISQEACGQYLIILPSEKEQIQIANYLDHKTTQIDNLIAKKEQFITLLQEERTAIINQAVTKGLDPTVKMKDSGIEWLGEIPEHWESWKIGHAFKKIGSGTTPESGNPIYHENGTINWLNTGDLNDSTLNECNKKVTLKALTDYSSLKLFPSGSLVMAMYGATIGKTAIINFETTTNQACCVFCNSEIIDLKFLQYWFKAKKEHIINLSIGGGQPNVSQQILKDIRLGCPDIVEQNKIVGFLDVKTIEIDTIISKTQQEIELLKEYKTALISEVVTGKVDVRDVVLN
ncbi:restriction endonuclease subunit S [Flavobacterium quisquiliarum]|uniref:Restriction endonuclease subunit S n=1 Tax=Flavobacterium quisquiliarum TaxID=1834436 RepID=A0ABV8W949_9FLAO|nr:restriction endonuclease subunit S [Flavobacterium quisquiliarum]MBW1654921.1 restriction endonuclease subunit S [Flavobacterium quisquiliarum]